MAQLGTTTAGGEITLDKLDELAAATVAGALKDSVQISRAVWDELKPELRYSALVESAHPVAVSGQRRYEQGDAAIVVVNAQWDLSVRCRYQQSDANQRVWSVLQDPMDISANVQVFLEERDGTLGQAQFIAAQVTSDTTLHFTADGSIISSTWSRDM